MATTRAVAMQSPPAESTGDFLLCVGRFLNLEHPS